MESHRLAGQRRFLLPLLRAMVRDREAQTGRGANGVLVAELGGLPATAQLRAVSTRRTRSSSSPTPLPGFLTSATWSFLGGMPRRIWTAQLRGSCVRRTRVLLCVRRRAEFQPRKSSRADGGLLFRAQAGGAVGGRWQRTGGAAGFRLYLARTGAKSGWVRPYSVIFLTKSFIHGPLTFWYSSIICAACGRIAASSLLMVLHCRSK